MTSVCMRPRWSLKVTGLLRGSTCTCLQELSISSGSTVNVALKVMWTIIMKWNQKYIYLRSLGSKLSGGMAWTPLSTAYAKNTSTITSISCKNMLGYLSANIVYSEKRAVSLERSLRKTMSYEEQIMSKDKYPSTFSPQMEAIMFIILQIFFAMHAVLKIGEYSWIFPSFSWGIFSHVMFLYQSSKSEKVWWIVRVNIITPFLDPGFFNKPDNIIS